MADTREQIENRIAMWRADLLRTDRDERVEASTETLLDSLVADVRLLALREGWDEGYQPYADLMHEIHDLEPADNPYARGAT